MGFEHKELSGSLFDNERKQSDRHPDFTGSCKIDGKDYWISAWHSEGRNKAYISLRFNLQEDSDNVRRPSGGDDRRGTQTDFQRKREEALARHRNRTADMKSRAAGDAGFEDDDIPF